MKFAQIMSLVTRAPITFNELNNNKNKYNKDHYIRI